MRIFAFLLFFSLTLTLNAQSDFYLVGEDASVNLNLSDNPAGDAGMLFEAKPIVRYRLTNNIRERIKNLDSTSFSASYLIFSPHIRMYSENSEPVKMPSYKVAFGFQQAWRINQDKSKYQDLLILAGETGHYSNGQSGCAFSDRYEDGTPPCDNIYNTINTNPNINLSDIMNRTNGHFQTNYTSLFLNYRKLKEDADVYTSSHSFQLMYTLYHRNMAFLFDFGGYSDNDIQIYGLHRFDMSYNYSTYGPKGTVWRFEQSLGFIGGAHESVTNYRSVSSATVYPWPKRVNLGLKASYIFGHDDYNLRFVDNVSQFTVGAVFSPFGLFSMNN